MEPFVPSESPDPLWDIDALPFNFGGDLDFDPDPFFESPLDDGICDPWPRARRSRFSDLQKRELKAWIGKTGRLYLTKAEVLTLALNTGLTLKQVRVFFMNFRMRSQAHRPRRMGSSGEAGVKPPVIAST
jgi:hypothetical protein